MDALLRSLAGLLSPHVPLDPSAIADLVETPPDPSMGDFAFPCFRLAKALRAPPAKIAADLASRIAVAEPFAKAQAAGPYLNFFLVPGARAVTTLGEIAERGPGPDLAAEGRGKTVVIDFSSPNIGKELAAHHLRSTCIGAALARIHRRLGWRVASINHLGDWGTQFGTLIAGYKRFHDGGPLGENPVALLNRLYVEESRLEKADPAAREEARAWFKRLEEGDGEAIRLWESFREASLAEFEKAYRTLGISFDLVLGEAHYSRFTGEIVELARARGIAKESEGALVVDLEPWAMPPILLLKSDGTTTYHTRDLAAALDRWRRFSFDAMLYVTDQGQSLHFAQLFKGLELLGFDWAARLRHVSFGLFKFQGEKTTTREGNVILLKDVLGPATAKALEITLANIEKDEERAALDQGAVAAAVGIGAVVFNDLRQNRNKDVNFSWEEALSLKGDTSPYLQFAHMRLASVLRKWGAAPPAPGDLSVLQAPEEARLIAVLARYPLAVRRAARDLEPSAVAECLLALASAVHGFLYGCRVLQAESEPLRDARLVLVEAARRTLQEGLSLLGLQAPDRM